MDCPRLCLYYLLTFLLSCYYYLPHLLSSRLPFFIMFRCTFREIHHGFRAYHHEYHYNRKETGSRGDWKIELWVGATFILPLSIFGLFHSLKLLIEDVFEPAKSDLGPENNTSKLTYIFRALPVNAQEVALKLWDRNTILPAGISAPGRFMTSVHGAEEANELKFGFIDEEAYKLLKEQDEQGLNARNLGGLHWVGIEASESN